MSGILDENWAESLPVPHDDGHFINAKVSRIVEIIRDIWGGRVDIKWVPPEFRSVDEPAFAIVENLPDGRTPVIFHVKDESEFDERVIARIEEADRNITDPFAAMEAHNRALRAYEAKVAQEQMDEAREIVRDVIRSPLSKYSVTLPQGKRVFRE